MAGTYVFFKGGRPCLIFGLLSSSLLFLRTSSLFICALSLQFCPLVRFLRTLISTCCSLKGIGA
jgi:hypothetical protein